MDNPLLFPMIVEELDEEFIHLLWKPFMNKMISFFYEDVVQIWHKILHVATSYVILHTVEFQDIVLLPHDQQGWNCNFWISYSSPFSRTPA
uniref:Uncharacterized protein MANES_12G085000 n=1 Tax=Rhizophora mucronata TaxID=61149 RepID=A0A2P2KQQ1_RHIMU